ncbi:MAG: hypothetical protein M9938_11445 [Solirubrobacterales bacterium]|nr:hypothetical protein [Solirubrobacterales bacterium]
MADPESPRQDVDSTRDHFEQAIGTAAPLLDLVLAVGERISRAAEPVDYEYYPVRDPDPDEDPEAGQEQEDQPAL